MAVVPTKPQSVTAYRKDMMELRSVELMKGTGTLMALALRARAPTAQVLPGVAAYVTVAPRDLQSLPARLS